MFVMFIAALAVPAGFLSNSSSLHMLSVDRLLLNSCNQSDFSVGGTLNEKLHLKLWM